MKGEVCLEGMVWKGKKRALDSQRHSFFGQEEVTFECFNPISPLVTFLPTSKHFVERDTSLKYLIHLNHKSLHAGIVLQAKKGP